MHIVLLEPEIPQNVGNIARTCVVTGSTLHLIKPLGFQLTDKKIKRAGMDYINEIQLKLYDDFNDFYEKNDKPVVWMATTKAKKVYTQADFTNDCMILFGKESAGIPEALLIAHRERAIRIPMLKNHRSLNMASSVAIILYEAIRQQQFEGLTLTGDLHRHSWEEQ